MNGRMINTYRPTDLKKIKSKLFDRKDYSKRTQLVCIIWNEKQCTRPLRVSHGKWAKCSMGAQHGCAKVNDFNFTKE